MSIIGAEEDEKLVNEEFPVLSIMPSRKFNDRVTKVASVEIETDELYECDVQTYTENEQIDRDTQTDIIETHAGEDVEVNEEYLGHWLESIYPKVANILENNTTDKVFANYEVKINDMFDTNKLLHELQTNFEFIDHGNIDDDDEQTVDDIADQFADYNRSAEIISNSEAKSTNVDYEESKSLSFDVTSLSWS